MSKVTYLRSLCNYLKSHFWKVLLPNMQCNHTIHSFKWSECIHMASLPGKGKERDAYIHIHRPAQRRRQRERERERQRDREITTWVKDPSSAIHQIPLCSCVHCGKYRRANTLGWPWTEGVGFLHCPLGRQFWGTYVISLRRKSSRIKSTCHLSRLPSL
jgi:hypothetical protein